jgi:hypothetical protein
MSQNLLESRTEPVPCLSESNVDETHFTPNVHRRPPRASGSRAGTNDVLAEASDGIGVDEPLLEPSARHSTEFGGDRANPLGEIDIEAGHGLNPPAFRFRRQYTFPWLLESFLCTSATLCFAGKTTPFRYCTRSSRTDNYFPSRHAHNPCSQRQTTSGLASRPA